MRSILLAAASLLAIPAAHAQTVSAPAPAPAPGPVASATSAAPVPRGRLSDAAIPQGYRLDLTIDPARERFSGRAEIDALLKARSASIFIHGRNLAVRKASATVGGRTVAANRALVVSNAAVAARIAVALVPGSTRR